MAPTLYILLRSPPVRAVLMTAKSIKLPLKLKEVDIFFKAQLTQKYLKINPQHTIPTLVEEDGFTLWDSHAIMAYLVGKYAKKDSLYPKDLRKRAIVDQRLHFDNGVMFSKAGRGLALITAGLKKSITQEDLDCIDESYAFMEAFLEGKPWAAGDALTIADFSLISTVSTINTQVPVEPKKFPNLYEWIKRCEALPEYQENVEGLEIWAKFISKMLNKV